MSYFGDVDHIINKIKNFAHQEYNTAEYLSPSYIGDRIKQKKDLFGRTDGTIVQIPTQENNYLPMSVHLLMQLFNQSSGQ